MAVVGPRDLPARAVPVVWGNVPQRNKNFTGRVTLLEKLRANMTAEGMALLPHALQGLGGVGKTQLAVEYAYKFSHDYQVVWWIPADQVALARASLAALAPRLGITGATRIEDAVSAVLDTLRRGDPYPHWLLIFDNADQPETIRELMPHGPGHVLVTSRNHRWHSMVDTVEVNVFSRAESLEFLGRRVPGISEADAERLAQELGNLPLALEQAGALQAETGMSVDDYLDLLGRATTQVLQENPPSDYPVPVAAAWSLSMARLRDQMPFALEILRRCAFFGAEPISRELLVLGRYVLDAPLRDLVADPIMMSRATRELGRYALARIDNHRRTLQVHRLIQRLIQDELDHEVAASIRDEVHAMLAAATPEETDTEERWPEFELVLPHVGPSGTITSRQPNVRRLVSNVVRYLYNVGDTEGSLALADEALTQWVSDDGIENRAVLELNRRKADGLWALGRYQEAYELRRTTLDVMRRVLGEDDEETLRITNGHGADLRARGEFATARTLDEDSLARHRRVFGDDHPETFQAANNLAVDLELTSDYRAAYETDEKTRQDRLDLYGRDDNILVIFSMNAVARDLRQLGLYLQARELAEQAYILFQDVVARNVLRENHAWVLLQAKDLSVARRMAGDFAAALELARDVHERYVRDFTAIHPDTLAAAINLGNALRRTGDLDSAAKLIEQTVRGYQQALGEGHPFTHASILNLAIIQRQIANRTGDHGRIEAARSQLQDALDNLTATVGPDHHYTLTCASSLATAHADLGEVDASRALGERVLPRLRAVLGEDHPHTLMCAANLALDLRAQGHEDDADELLEDTLRRYRRVLREDHPDVREVADGVRVDFVFEPSPL
ncbi:tetratricopeptide repeat protein [Frankia sp. CNm7]|uniref:Tetratricopeptide repeat protein n=1 Tax=Frankia nepalensis TaxID=1836974 RepID=A0A937RK76_9ACTN|nr:FxSxx-COOH system tetratricopeptide repeat protein [Frankia nepalensis]MBL7498135.1 tetratricopeptide repeat protein [Frankia nepalensis]MBL7509347.1 tetratricopeptide repeat protein [Frankia nepalensis]MBL7516865.1 tetratricopeptide repeat protein [Frankia nepalensis]MBL7627923.1 tetratricopeptide repeat protein [Frankia nepalensis]